MDGAEFGAYMLLIVACYQSSSHRLPDEDSRLCRMARVSPKIWARVRPAVMNKFIHKHDLNSSWFEHERINSESKRYQSKSTKNKTNALIRWDTGMQVASEAQCERNATQDPRPKTIPPSSLPDSRGKGVLNGQGGEGKFSIVPMLSDPELAAAKRNAPGWDIYELARIYNAGVHNGRRDRPNLPGPAFAGWCKSFTKGKNP